MKGRNVHLQRISLLNAPPECPSAADVWETLVSVQGDGQWWSVEQTRGLDKPIIARLRKALLNRHWYCGYTDETLTILATSMDGICFHWQYGEAIDERAEILERREARLEKRRKKVKA